MTSANLGLFALSLAITGAVPVLAAPFPPAPLPAERPWTGASERLIAGKTDPWITPAEASDFIETPDYAATRAWLEKLVAASPLLTLESFGTSPEGRDLYFVRASKGPGRPVVLAQGGIHAGEIDGKDAGMMLLRDIALRGKDGLLDKADLVFVPIFNVDGHERSSAWSRPNQRGPREQGWRTTAQNLNLNRDYLKADAPEMQAMIGLINKLDPVLYLDLHVTDGADFQYDINTGFVGWQGQFARSPAIGRWLDGRFRPAVDTALKRAGHLHDLYVNAVDPDNLGKGIITEVDKPRYSTGYGDARRLPSVLVELHSLKNYRRRVLATYVLVEEALRLAGDEAAGLRAAIAADRAARPVEATLRWKPKAEPLYTMDFLGLAHDRVASAASGRKEIRWLDRPVTQKLPVFGEEPELTVRLPRAWWVPASATSVIERLKLHGIAFETITAPKTLTVDMVRLVDPKLGTPDEGHVPVKAGFAHETRTETFPPGSVRVPADQPLGLLAAELLEAEAPDSALAWNFFPAILQRTEYMEPYVTAPMADAMLKADPALQARFEAKLAADPAFAADGDARLAWFYAQTPYFDDRYLLYPIAREIEPAR
jgi:murein tripeptide amidase MpaA